MGLVSIGEFSRLSRLSPKALRLYDDLGLLVPDHVDAATGYRWYADTQLDQARVVGLLRRIGVPLAQIKDMLALDPASAAGQVRDYWARTETEHAAQRELVGYLVDRLDGKKSAMYEVAVRDIPARSLLSLMRHAHQDEVMQMGREFFIHRMMRGGIARVEGIAGAPFTKAAIESLVAWASEQQRQPSDVRMVLVFNPANQGAGPDTEFALALR